MVNLLTFLKFSCRGDTVGPKGCADESVLAKIKSEWNMLRDVLTLLISRCLPLGTKEWGESWPVKEGDVIRLERIDVTTLTCMSNVRSEDRISLVELRKRLQLKAHSQV